MKVYLKYVVLFFILVSCKTNQSVVLDPIKDIPKNITNRFVIPMVNNKETALGMCKLIIKERYAKVDVDKLVLDKAILVANDKVWEIVLRTPNLGFGYIFNIRINKNTGEILNFWVVK